MQDGSTYYLTEVRIDPEAGLCAAFADPWDEEVEPIEFGFPLGCDVYLVFLSAHESDKLEAKNSGIRLLARAVGTSLDACMLPWTSRVVEDHRGLATVSLVPVLDD